MQEKFRHARTATNPKGGGRPPGARPDLQTFPGILGDQRLSWNRQRAQAKFRGEAWDISWEQFQDIWRSQWHLRGRCVNSLCMTRRDWSGVWDIDNIELVTRAEHFKRQGQAKRVKNALTRQTN